MSIDMNIFIERINELMEDEKLLAQDLCRGLNLPSSVISYWLNGIYLPEWQNLIALADYFNCSVDFILGLSNEETFKRSDKTVSFAERIKEQLKINNITAYKLSKQLPIQQSTISK